MKIKTAPDQRRENVLLRFLRRYALWSVGWLHLALFFLAMLGLDAGLMHFFSFAQMPGLEHAQDLRLLTPGWVLLFTGIAAMLPGLGRKIWMTAVSLVFCVLGIVHGVFINMYSKFFSFSDIAFAGDGAAFMDGSYLVIRKIVLAWIIGCFCLTVLAVLLTPRKAKPALKGGIPVALAGLALILSIRYTVLGEKTVMVWNQNIKPSFLYEDFTDSRANLSMLGLYQYTFRDVTNILETSSGITEEEAAQLEAWMEGRTHENNEMTGIFEGKNLILIQLESVDKWMLTESYMPNLYAIKQNSLSFERHYTPAYITAGTFNTEFMVNTSLMPADSGLSMAVYSKNAFPNSMASLFAQKGYAANSFHGSEADIYNRGPIHENLGYEKYWAGSDMQMTHYQFDRYLMSGYEAMTAGDPFFSFIITISGHGAYGPNNAIGKTHQEAADAVAERSEDNYRYAVAHTMETDLFIGQLMERLEADGLLENTVLVFYADHYNYYMLDDGLMMEIKGVDTINKLCNTDFFIYDGGNTKGTVETVTSSLDVLPTLANLFNLDIDYSACLGHDAFSADGGYVFFQDNSWFDGTEWSTTIREDFLTTRKMGQLILTGDWFAREK